MTDLIKKLTIDEWESRIFSDEITDAEVMQISLLTTGEGPFDIRLVPNPDIVDVPDDYLRTENAMVIGNRYERRKRRRKFERRLREGDASPVIVTEMDSWGQFPVVIREVVDHLNSNGFNCWSLGAAGDTAANMVYGPVRKEGQEYLLGLEEQRSLVRAFVFSAAGNDIIGEDPQTGVPALSDIVKDFNGDATDVSGHIDRSVMKARLDELRKAYDRVVAKIRAHASFGRLPIIIHGYDVPFPYPFGPNDGRTPLYLGRNPDKWLGSVFRDKGIPIETLGRAILKQLIDELYGMLYSVSGNPRQTHIWVVNCRGAMPNLSDWNDEIHGTSRGFAFVAGRFIHTLRQAIAHAES